MKSPTQAIGKYANISSVSLRLSKDDAALEADKTFLYVNTTPFGFPVVPEV